MKKILALAFIISAHLTLYSNCDQACVQPVQESSEDVIKRACGGGICCPISQSCSTTLSTVSLAGSFSFTVGTTGTVTTTVTQGSCFTVVGSFAAPSTLVFTVSFLRPFSIAPVVLAQLLSGSTPLAITNVTNTGFTVTTSTLTGTTSDVISFIAQQACT